MSRYDYLVGPDGLEADFRAMQGAIDFVAKSWWRRWGIRIVSGGRVRFERGRDAESS